MPKKIMAVAVGRPVSINGDAAHNSAVKLLEDGQVIIESEDAAYEVRLDAQTVEWIFRMYRNFVNLPTQALH